MVGIETLSGLWFNLDNTSGPVLDTDPDFLNSLFSIVVKAGIVTRDTLWEPSLASWFLVKKTTEGNMVTFSHWPKLDTCLQPRREFRCGALPEAKASKKAV